ncbi:TPA: hypothetical protein ROX98_001817 [Bacillus pseudomycoides]|nr:hypothetical protein [Bacillus pseudomycoides]
MRKALLCGGIIASVLWTGSYVNAEEINQETKQFANKIENLPKGSISNPAFRGQIEEMVNKFIIFGEKTPTSSANGRWGMNRFFVFLSI